MLSICRQLLYSHVITRAVSGKSMIFSYSVYKTFTKVYRLLANQEEVSVVTSDRKNIQKILILDFYCIFSQVFCHAKWHLKEWTYPPFRDKPNQKICKLLI